MKRQTTILILLLALGTVSVFTRKGWSDAPVQPVPGSQQLVFSHENGEPESVLDKIDRQSRDIRLRIDSSVIQSGKEIVAMLDYLILMSQLRESQEEPTENGSDDNSGNESNDDSDDSFQDSSSSQEGNRSQNKNADSNKQSDSQNRSKESGEGEPPSEQNQSGSGTPAPVEQSSSGDSPAGSLGGGLAPAGRLGTGRVRNQKFDTNIAWWELPLVIREKNAPPTVNQLPPKYRKLIETYYLQMAREPQE